MPDEKTLRREGGEGHGGLWVEGTHSLSWWNRLGGRIEREQLVTGSQEAGSRQEVGLGYKTSRSSLQFASTF